MRVFDSLDWATYAFFTFQHKNRPQEFTRAMEVGDWFGSYLGVALVLVLASALMVRSHVRAVFRVWVVFAAGVVLVELVKLATHRPRPDDAVNYLGPGALSSSFPCVAVFLTLYVWFMLALALRPWTRSNFTRILIFATPALAFVYVAVSELWLGLHFVTDVFGGLAGGCGLALIGWRWVRPTLTSPAS